MRARNILMLLFGNLCLTGYAGAAGSDSDYWYAGGKVAYSKYLDGGMGEEKKHAAYGMFGGYQFSPFTAVELGYDFLGKGASELDFDARGTQLTTKLSYPVHKEVDIYVRGGGMAWRSDTTKGHTSGVSPVLAVGSDWALNQSFNVRFDAQWVNNIDGVGLKQRVDNASFGVGILYLFPRGNRDATSTDYQPAPAPVQLRPVVSVEPKMPQTFTLKSDVLFHFGSSALKPEAYSELDQIVYKLKSSAQWATLDIMGFTDRLGSESYNKMLSQKRADVVKSYFVAQGISGQKLYSRGMGSNSNNTLTMNRCNSIKPKQVLIDCLAPDRRVEIKVNSN